MCWSGAVSLTCELFSRQFGYGRRGVYNTFNRLISHIHDSARYIQPIRIWIHSYICFPASNYLRPAHNYVRLLSKKPTLDVAMATTRSLISLASGADGKSFTRDAQVSKKKWENRPKERTKEKRRMHLTASERPRKASPWLRPCLTQSQQITARRRRRRKRKKRK